VSQHGYGYETPGAIGVGDAGMPSFGHQLVTLGYCPLPPPSARQLRRPCYLAHGADADAVSNGHALHVPPGPHRTAYLKHLALRHLVEAFVPVIPHTAQRDRCER
jgi:hypothetical protein